MRKTCTSHSLETRSKHNNPIKIVEAPTSHSDHGTFKGQLSNKTPPPKHAERKNTFNSTSFSVQIAAFLPYCYDATILSVDYFLFFFKMSESPNVILYMSLSSLYRLLPYHMQNAGLSLYGALQYRIRYGHPIDEPYKSRAFDSQNNVADTKALQEARLAELVSHASEYVPYYKELLEKKKVKASDVNLDNFQEIFPILSKDTVLQNPKAFVSSKLAKDAIKLFTSGTSGSPLAVACSREARAINYFYFRRMLNQYNCDVKDRSITFAGRLITNKNETKRFWRKDFYNNTMYCSSYHLTDDNIPLYLEAINLWEADYIDSYPSAIDTIARYINENNLILKKYPKLIVTSSESLTDSQKENIKAAFRCPILDQFGCTEMAIFAYSYNGAPYKNEDLYSIIEFEEIGLSDEASLICTGLLNFAMPLIRYRIGDTVYNPKSSDNNRFSDIQFDKIIGRLDDYILTPEGIRVGRMDPAFKGLTGILKAQIVQESINDIVVIIIPNEPNSFTQENSAKLAQSIKDRTSHQMNVSFKIVSDIPLTKSGKFKSVVSKLSAHQQHL